MKRSRVSLTALVCAGLLSFGCQQSPQQDTTAGSSSLLGPEQLVTEFLQAVRAGDDDKAGGLLTPLARKKTSEMEMVVAPPGSETAKFKVLSSENVGEDVHVSSDWTDLDTDGRPHTDRIVWIVRKNAEGWRIAGMSTRVFADQEPIVLNFEDPADMLRKQQQAEDEIARRDKQPGPTDRSSEVPSGTVR
jgi:hypothetical protein